MLLYEALVRRAFCGHFGHSAPGTTGRDRVDLPTHLPGQAFQALQETCPEILEQWPVDLFQRILGCRVNADVELRHRHEVVDLIRELSVGDEERRNALESIK